MAGPPRAHNPRRAITLKIGATLGFTLMFAFAKLAGDVPTGQVVFFRAIFALLTLLVVVALTGKLREIAHTHHPGWHVVRGLVGVSAMFCNFAAVAKLPLADMTALTFVMPIFAVILSVLILKEKVGPYRSSAVLVGFIGVLVMLQPQGGIGAIIASGFSTGTALALCGALLSAMVIIFVRQMSVTERSETIVFYFMTTATLVGGLSMLWAWAPLSYSALAWLALAGVAGGLGQLCMTFCYRYGEPSLLAPFDYTAMLWAIGLGLLFFGVLPGIYILGGTALVASAGIFIAVREHRLGRASHLKVL